MKALILLLAVVLVLGCTQEKGVTELAEEKCISLCKQTTDLSKGPCLSNEIAPDWVCDVAHYPRQAVDNLPANQCEGFRNGSAHHFVEVDTSCNTINLV
jgi:hypothetical protein